MPNFYGNNPTSKDKDDFWALYDFHLPSYNLHKQAFLLYLKRFKNDINFLINDWSELFFK